MLARLALVALLLALAPASAAPAGHYVPHAGDSFTFEETIAVSGGYGNYSGYTESDAIVGTVNVTSVLSNGTENATYDYTGYYENSLGTAYPWTEKGTFIFSAATFDYVQGTDDQPGDNGTEVWFYMNDSLPAGSSIDPLATGMTVRSLDTSYALGTSAGADVETIYAVGTGSYLRHDSYGLFDATYAWRSYFDPATGYIVAYDYTELDADSHGDGFVYTDALAVTKTTYPLTAAAPPSTYPVTFTETGLGSGTSWTVTFNGVPQSGTGSSLSFPGYANGTYLFGVSSSGRAVTPATGWITVDGPGPSQSVAFAATAPPSPWGALLVLLLVVVVVVVLVVVIAAAVRRSRRRPHLPQHSYGGRPEYGAPPPGPTPPPISLAPGDQPRIQQVVVKEVVKVNCRYCGSLIDSTAEKCPFCGATRT